LRRRLALVLASCESLIVQANVEEALEFLQQTERELSFEDAFAIYFRLVGVPTRIQNAVTIHTLSRIGGEAELEAVLDAAPEERARGLRALARRLQGRRRESLRNEVEMATTRARARVRGSYLDGANRTVESLRDIVSTAEAVQYFIDALQLGQGWAELVFHEIMGMAWAEPPREVSIEPVPGPDGEPSSAIEPLQPGATDHDGGQLETPDADA
jgi:hypothetical protein